MKKIIILIVVILILLSGIAIFLMANNELSKDEFISVMKGFDQVSNVKIEGSMTKYIKDEYMLSIRDDGLYTWANSKTEECISYFPNDKIYAFVDYVNSDNIGVEESEYTFIGYEKYNGTKCIVGEFKTEIEKEVLTTRIWIDAERGTCLKIVNAGIDFSGNQYEIVEEYTATYDIVTDEDVKKPDLTEYTEYNVKGVEK